MSQIHIPVLASEVVEILDPQAGEVFVDATVGLGGHARLLLEKLGEKGKLIGIDQDEEALKHANDNLAKYRDQVVLVHGNFRSLGDLVQGIQHIWARSEHHRVDGILLDVGISSLQIDTPERGFSFNNSARLDMRMDLGGYLTAEEVVNSYSFEELVRIFREYGEERRAALIAKRIVEVRRKKRIETTFDLVEIIGGRPGKIHPATRVFQALRIEVNDELGALKDGLRQAIELLKPGARLAVITFHSLEDRLVKNFLKEQVEKGVGELVNKKVITPKWEEKKVNRRARSAKLRVFEKN
jgi:16S rRNA (cytosine1402-N4)-methyltransferase